MKTLQQIRIEQIPIGELRHNPAVKRREQLNQASMGVGGAILYNSLSRATKCSPRANYREFPK